MIGKISKEAQKIAKDGVATGTAILPCSCRHQFQDNRYGYGLRLHNIMRDGGRRCTVCSGVKKK